MSGVVEPHWKRLERIAADLPLRDGERERRRIVLSSRLDYGELLSLTNDGVERLVREEQENLTWELEAIAQCEPGTIECQTEEEVLTRSIVVTVRGERIVREHPATTHLRKVMQEPEPVQVELDAVRSPWWAYPIPAWGVAAIVAGLMLPVSWLGAWLEGAGI